MLIKLKAKKEAASEAATAPNSGEGRPAYWIQLRIGFNNELLPGLISCDNGWAKKGFLESINYINHIICLLIVFPTN